MTALIKGKGQMPYAKNGRYTVMCVHCGHSNSHLHATAQSLAFKPIPLIRVLSCTTTLHATSDISKMSRYTAIVLCHTSNPFMTALLKDKGQVLLTQSPAALHNLKKSCGSWLAHLNKHYSEHCRTMEGGSDQKPLDILKKKGGQQVLSQ